MSLLLPLMILYHWYWLMNRQQIDTPRNLGRQREAEGRKNAREKKEMSKERELKRRKAVDNSVAKGTV